MRYFLSLLLVILSAPSFVRALDLSSPNFILRDPLSVVEGGHATSTNFRFFSSTGQTAIGQISGTSFLYRSGFLYFPVVTSPVLSATPGNAEVALSWSAATAALGFTVTSYQVGVSTTSGGPYDYTGVGNVLTSVRTGLTNGTTYFFVIRVADALGDTIATSTQIAAQPTNPGGGGGPLPPPPPPPPPPAPGAAPPPGAVPPVPVFATEVIARGQAWPGAEVILLKDGERAVSGPADSDGVFELRLTEISPGSYLFALYATDQTGRQSAPVTMFIEVLEGRTTFIDGVFVGPVIETDKREVALGEDILIFGQTVPLADVTIFLDGAEQLILQTQADRDGRFTYSLPTAQLPLGEYRGKVESRKNGTVSSFSRTLVFRIGTKTIFAPPFERCGVVADLDDDCRIDLIDFSMLLFWFGKPNPPAHIDFDRNNRVDLSDFSILIYYWTG